MIDDRATATPSDATRRDAFGGISGSTLLLLVRRAQTDRLPPAGNPVVAALLRVYAERWPSRDPAFD